MRASIRLWQELERRARRRPRGERVGRAASSAPTTSSSATSSARRRSRRTFGVEVELLDRAGLEPRRAVRLRPTGRRPASARSRGARIRCSRRPRSRARPRARARGCCRGPSCARSSGRRTAGSAPRRVPAPIECGRIVDCAGAEAGDVAGLAGAPVAVDRYPIQVSATEAGAAARLASRLLRRRPADAEAGPPGNAPDRRRLACAARRPHGSARRRLPRRSARTSASRSRSCRRCRGGLAPAHVARRLPRRCPTSGRSIGELLPGLRRRDVPVPRLHLRSAAGPSRRHARARRGPGLRPRPFAPSRLL